MCKCENVQMCKWSPCIALINEAHKLRYPFSHLHICIFAHLLRICTFATHLHIYYAFAHLLRICTFTTHLLYYHLLTIYDVNARSEALQGGKAFGHLSSANEGACGGVDANRLCLTSTNAYLTLTTLS